MNPIRLLALIVVLAVNFIYPNLAHATPTVRTSAAGSNHTCVVSTIDFTLHCWGKNDRGQLGLGSSVAPSGGGATSSAATSTPTPMQTMLGAAVPDLGHVYEVSAGGDTTCAIAQPVGAPGLGLYCWGDNTYGQLGIGAVSGFYPSPVPVMGLSTGIASVSVGATHTCATQQVTNGLKLMCWGRNDHGQLGNNTHNNSNIPVDVAISPNYLWKTAISAGFDHTCGIWGPGSSSGLFCWGSNAFNQLGVGNASGDVLAPSTNASPLGVGTVDVSASDRHTCAVQLINSAFSIYCWGLNASHEAGANSTANVLTPTKIALPNGEAVSIIMTQGATAHHHCVITDSVSDPVAACWGSNAAGQFGIGWFGYRNANPVKFFDYPAFAGLHTINVVAWTQPRVGIVAGEGHTCVRFRESLGGIVCFGRNTYGNLSRGTSGFAAGDSQDGFGAIIQTYPGFNNVP